ncbi:MAG: hypothetical protein ABW168_08710 [Sedimenticola sp.]
MTTLAELGDITRFDSLREWMAFPRYGSYSRTGSKGFSSQRWVVVKVGVLLHVGLRVIDRTLREQCPDAPPVVGYGGVSWSDCPPDATAPVAQYHPHRHPWGWYRIPRWVSENLGSGSV